MNWAYIVVVVLVLVLVIEELGEAKKGQRRRKGKGKAKGKGQTSDPCDEAVCQNGATCMSVNEDEDYVCLCGSGYTGMLCEAECYNYFGKDYAGTDNMTESGRTCQRWDSQAPHPHPFTNPDWIPDSTVEEAENHCRNPNAACRPWCFTTDIHRRWEFCGTPRCFPETIHPTVDVNECYIQHKNNYTGIKSTTISGTTCQRWDSQTPHGHPFSNAVHFPDSTLQEAENYCRTPDLGCSPWCYTTDPDLRWEFCDLPRCPD